MPNLNEFFQKEVIMKPEMEKFDGVKPCGKCEKDSSVYYWDPTTYTMSWSCPDGHENSYKVNS